MWWMREYVQTNVNGRPHLIEMYHGENVEFNGIKWMNSPNFHFHCKDITNFWFHDFEIYTDMMGQLYLAQLFQNIDWTPHGITLPTYALNTDGVDIAGTNILVERLKITNYDDAVAIKPQDSTGYKAKCAENIMVRDIEVYFGVGMTIGSVPPHDEYNCVSNVTFLNVTFYHPFKAVYVKTNPGTTETMLPGSGGEITNILYENLTIYHPIWWSIYIGPQQQKQPGGDGPGCMLYPLTPCETQPLIHVANITLRNVQQHGTLLPPGIVRCNETNPCTGFVFDNVDADGWWKWLRLGYITENIYGDVSGSRPMPEFLDGEPSGDLIAKPSLGAYEIIHEALLSNIQVLAFEFHDLVRNNRSIQDMQVFKAF